MKNEVSIEQISIIVREILGKEELIKLLPRIDPTTLTINTNSPEADGG
ncbi:hypothetical protein [Acidianus brierleyi]|nr:hypothetical protein [Acidianus brierleyi]